MNIEQFNNKIVEAGKRLLGDKYSFSSSSIDSVMYGHIDKTTTTYRAAIFDKNNVATSVNSENIDLVFEMLELEHKKLNTVQSSIDL